MSSRNARAVKPKRQPAGPVGQRNLPLLMLRGREALLQHFRPVFNRFDLTEQQWRILRFLSDEGEVEQRLLAAHCQILGPSLTNMLSRLTELDYVARRRSADDQRRVFVALTAKGRRLIVTVAPFIAEQYRVIEARIGAGMMEELIAVLDRLLDLFEPDKVAESNDDA